MSSGEPALDGILPGRLNRDGIRIHAPEDFAGAWGVIAKPYTERGVREALRYVMAGQHRDADEARTVTFVPFGAAPRERSPQAS